MDTNKQSPLTAFLQSRKAWVLMLAIVVVTVLVALGKLDKQAGLDFIKWVVMSWLGAQAAEDSAAKMGQAKTDTAVINMAGTVDPGAVEKVLARRGNGPTPK